MNVPVAWYSIAADLDVDLRPEVSTWERAGAGAAPELPLGLVRQELSREPWLPIPREVRDRYATWRPTPLRRATGLERAINTKARLFYKYEGGNLAGSHELTTAVAQAYYHRTAGARRLVTVGDTGRWGVAVAVACRMFDLGCQVYLGPVDHNGQSGRGAMMELLGASVTPSTHGPADASAALSDGGTRLCAGGGRTYSLPHNTVIGLEAEEQLRQYGASPDMVVAGEDFTGVAVPFLRTALAGRGPLRCVVARSADGAWDDARATIIDLLRDRRMIEAVTYHRRDVFAAAVRFARHEGVLPAPESAAAVHGAMVEAARADERGDTPTILFSVSGHGLFDLPAYRAYLTGDTRRDNT
jgi:tryptophan synthase beta chain